MPAESFLDTNLFIYQLDGCDERKAEIANGIIRRAIQTGEACISFQVVQECLNTFLRKAEIRLDEEQARRYLNDVLSPLLQINASIALYQRALSIQARYQFAFYDSMIVAAALEAGCTRLYSEDLQHGQQIEQLRIENPF